MDYKKGILFFAADQRGAALYLNFRSYDLAGAAAAAWRQRAAGKADKVDFTADGLNRRSSQWYDHCCEQAKWYEGMSKGYGAMNKPAVVQMVRGDFAAW